MEAWIGDVLRLRDEVGVLSVYVGVDPASEAHARPGWRIRLDNDLHAIARRLHEEGNHARRTAFEERLEALAPTLDELVDAAEPGRGRALFVTVGSGEVHRFTFRVELPTGAMLGEIAHVVPLLGADDGRPRTLILVGRDTVRVLEATVGRLDELQAFDVEPVVYDGAERKGPTASNPLRGQKVSAQRERWERHVEADHERRLARTAAGLVRFASARHWEVGLVAGDPRGADVLVEALRKAGVETELVQRDLAEVSPAQALAELGTVLDSMMARRHLALVTGALDAAAAGGHGAAGLQPVLGALDQGLVEQLLLDPDSQTFDADPHLGDRLILRAFETGAPTTVVGREAAAALRGVDGVAALLRARPWLPDATEASRQS